MNLAIWFIGFILYAMSMYFISGYREKAKQRIDIIFEAVFWPVVLPFVIFFFLIDTSFELGREAKKFKERKESAGSNNDNGLS